MNLHTVRVAAIVLTLATSTTIALNAQGARLAPSPEDRAKTLQNELKLTDDQTAKIVMLFKNEEECLQVARGRIASTEVACRLDPGMSKAARLKALKTQTDMGVEALLTPDQQAAYRKLQAKHSQKSGKKGA